METLFSKNGAEIEDPYRMMQGNRGSALKVGRITSLYIFRGLVSKYIGEAENVQPPLFS